MKLIDIKNADKITEAYMPLIYATVKRFSAFEKKEAIDEARMVLIEAILSYNEDKGSFGNYLKHRLNYYFWDKAKKPLDLSIGQENQDGISLADRLEAGIDIEDDFFTKEGYKDLYANINKLDKKDVAIIKMKYWKDMTDKEIGRALNLSPKTIRNRHSMALKDLRRMME